MNGRGTILLCAALGSLASAPSKASKRGNKIEVKFECRQKLQIGDPC